MIIFFISVLMLIIFSIPIYYYRKKGKDFFEPEVLISYIHIITIIPYLMYVSVDNDIVSDLVRNHYSFVNMEKTIFKYFLLQILAFLFLHFGMKYPVIFSKKQISLIISEKKRKDIIIIAIIAFVIGLFSYVFIISSLGGLNYLINNFHQRTNILAGNSYILLLTNFLPLSVYLYIFSFKYKKITISGYFKILAMATVTLFFSAIFGGRKNLIFFLIICFLVWHYSVNKIRLLSIRNIFLIAVVSIFFIIMPLLRVPGAVNDFRIKDKSLINEVKQNIEILITQTSYVDHYLLIVNYFEINNIWLGRSYIDLIKAPIPSSIYPNKPPVDDGVYLRTIAEGVDVIPSMPYNQLFQSSWPPESFGILYMNFWVPGIILGMFMLGNIYKKLYMFMARSNYSIFSLLVYGTIITNFHFTNLRIVQTILTIVFYLIFFCLLFGVSQSKKISKLIIEKRV